MSPLRAWPSLPLPCCLHTALSPSPGSLQGSPFMPSGSSQTAQGQGLWARQSWRCPWQGPSLIGNKKVQGVPECPEPVHARLLQGPCSKGYSCQEGPTHPAKRGPPTPSTHTQGEPCLTSLFSLSQGPRDLEGLGVARLCTLLPACPLPLRGQPGPAAGGAP